MCLRARSKEVPHLMRQRVNVRGQIAGVLLIIIALAITTSARSTGVKPTALELVFALIPGVLLIALNTLRRRPTKR
jgi:hypothetical protein